MFCSTSYTFSWFCASAAAELVHHAHVEEGRGFAFFGGLPVVAEGGGVVAGHALAVGVGVAESVEGFGVATAGAGLDRGKVRLGREGGAEG